MKTIYTIILLTLIPYQGILSQVGINTLNMQKNGTVDCVIQIDPKGNNNITGNPLDSQTTDDIFIDAQGRMSVGHINPTHKLHIKTKGTNIAPIAGLKLEDGSQGNTKLLISDQYGNSSWAYVGETPIVKGVLDPNGVDVILSSNTTLQYRDTKSYIKLPPGRWLVAVNMILSTSGTGTLTNRYWIRSTFRDSPTATESSPDFVPAFGRWISGLVYWGALNVMNGFVILLNSTASVKTYYYSTGFFALVPNKDGSSNSTLLKFGSSSYKQNNILAFKMSDN